MKSIQALPKRRGRPPTGKDPVSSVRLSTELREALDAWVIDQKLPKPSRSEAIRRIVTDHLRRKGYLPKAGK